MEATEGPVLVFMDGEEKRFSSGMACLEALYGEYEVETIHEVKLVLRKVNHSESWMQIWAREGREGCYLLLREKLGKTR